MKTILTIALKDLTIALKNRPQMMLTLVMPIILMVIIGNAINFEIAKVNLDVVNRDENELASRFVTTLKNTAGEQVFICQYGQENDVNCGLEKDVKPENDVVAERIEDTQTAAALIIPADFSTQISQGETPTLIFQSDDSLNAPTLTNQAVESAMSRVGSSVVIARVGTDVLAKQYTVENQQALFDSLYTQAEARWQASPPITVTTQEHGSDRPVGSGVNQSAPGTSSMFVLINLLAVASILLYERQNGTLQRLFTVPAPKYQIVIGKIAAPMLYALIQFTILIIVGALIGVDWGDNWLGIGLIVVSFILCCTALGFLLATIARTSVQADSWATLMAFILAPLGGAWWPLDIVPDFMVTIGHISPIAWAMDGFKDIVWYNGTLGDILPEIAVLLAMGAVFMTIGVKRFKYE